ncbi:MAG TPA: transcriptional regulator [Candidatus Omnitrophica bacterium]|nr:transcriptional regulator [Candidatus Omnitrophota bacterium]HCI45102.1 transcriptional regulator [Candidatus Omnitrophota bacterium]
MAITRDFKETVQARALQDPEFREGMLRESLECMLAGDLKTGKALLRDYINAIVGFERLGKLTKKDPKSLMRMFSTDGNPTASNLFDVIYALEKKEHIHYQLRPTPS